MAQQVEKMMDGNEAASSVAYRLNEVAVIYPITPSSPMGENADDWSVKGVTNIFGEIPFIYEMQSEAGAIAAVHGALQAGTFATTFTASQGLLLMIPNMYKIAGELTSFVMHVAARSIATHALSIFGDHSDVMACRQTGFAMLASDSVQEAQDMAAIAQRATIRAKVPFLHFFDGFRTSHEINKIVTISDEELKDYMSDLDLNTNLNRALTPDKPFIRGTAQNPDVFFQIREAANEYYNAVPAAVEEAMDKFAKLTGRKYSLVDYFGANDAETVIVIMGSAAETSVTAAEYLNKQGEKVGVIKVHLYRPFPVDAFLKALPASVKTIQVLDRTKESGSIGEPLYLDVVATLNEALEKGTLKTAPKVFGGRYGLSSKDFTPAMAAAVFANKDKKHFTIGIDDDVTNMSLPFDENFDIEDDSVARSIFFGLGSDGTVGANKNSIKIIADDGGFYGQAYFVYDSKKSGAMTTSHLRFSKNPIKAPYVINKAQFVAVHHFPFLEKIDLLTSAADGAVLLLNAPYEQDEVWNNLPKEMQQTIIDKKLKLYSIDAIKVAKETDMGRRINTIMQVCFFAISNVLPKDKAIADIKKSIEKTYGKKGADVVAKNIAAVDAALSYLHPIDYTGVTNDKGRLDVVSADAPEIVKNVTAKIIEGKGDKLPVSAFQFTADGTWPSDTAKYEKRRVAVDIPVWDPNVCIQCGKCAMVCPHAAIRLKAFDGALLKDAPATFKYADYKGKEFGDNAKFVVQVAPEDCTGCTLCSKTCPAKAKDNPEHKALNMAPIDEHLEDEIKNFDFFLDLPEVDRTKLNLNLPKFCQMLQPLFEFSGACAGCGETPYIKLMTQLFGDRALIANATGCTSIYSGNLPTTPYAKNKEGRGPAWSNSLFEDPAEFGLGMHFAAQFKKNQALHLLNDLSDKLGADLVNSIVTAPQATEEDLVNLRAKIDNLKVKLKDIPSDKAKLLLEIADYLVDKSVWIIGGDGWAYDIGYGGLDHILHSGKNVNVLVLDTNVYSNTGGQQSKATPIGASAKFAANGKEIAKKDLGLIAMASGKAYVAQVSLGAKDTQTITAFREAESYDGPSIIIAYSHCISHGYDLADGLEHQKLAVETGLWPLYRYDPRRKEQGLNPLQLDSKPTDKPVSEFMDLENRFKLVKKMNPERYDELVKAAEAEVLYRNSLYKYMSEEVPDKK